MVPTLVLVAPLLVTAAVLYTTVHSGIATTLLFIGLFFGLGAFPVMTGGGGSG